MIDRQNVEPAHDRTSALCLVASGTTAEMAEAEDSCLPLARFRAPRNLSGVTRYLTLTPACDGSSMHDIGPIKVTGLLVALAARAGLDAKVMLRDLMSWGSGKGWGWRRMNHVVGMGFIDGSDPPSWKLRDGVLDLSLPLRDMTVTSEAARDRVAVLVRQLPPPSIVNLLPGEHVRVLFGDAFPLTAETATVITATHRESIGRLSVIVNCPSITL